VRGDVAQQPAHANPSADERQHQAHGKHRCVGNAQQLTLFVQAVRPCTDERGNGQVKRKVGGRLARQAQQHATNDGRAAAAGAGNHGQALHQAHFQSVEGRHGFHRFDACRLNGWLFFALRLGTAPALGPQDDEAADDERARDHSGREQMRFDELAKQQAQHHGGHKGDQHIQGKALRLALAGQRHHGAENLLPVHDDDCQDRAGLNGNVKHLALVIVEPQQRARQNQMARA